jgi:alanine or glycine:cation symporter, AGCS family
MGSLRNLFDSRATTRSITTAIHCTMDFSNLLRLVAFDWPLFLVVLALAAFYTIITKAIQFSRAGLIARETLGAIRERNLGSSGQITAFQATMIAMCGTVGTGSIIGVTAGILLGGPGAVLWLWIFALLSMALKYGEATLSVHFRRVYTDGSTFGGPFVYIARGLGGRVGAVIGGLFALLAILAAFGVGNLAQVSGAATTLDASFDVPSIVWSFVLAALVLVVIGGGPKRIARTAQILFPVMIVLYAVLALALMLKNITGLGGAFVSIFSNALSFQAAGAGGVAYGLQAIIAQGFGRGLFASSAGLGVSSIAHAQAQVDHPVRQGFWGVVEVFGALVVSSLTALAMLSVPSLWQNNLSGAPAEVIRTVFSGLGVNFGADGMMAGGDDFLITLGSSALAITTALFALATMIAWAFYAEEAASHLFGDGVRWPVRLVWTAVAFLAPVAVVDYGNLIGGAEVLVGLMAIPNIVALAVLHPVVAGLTRGFFAGEPYNPPDGNPPGNADVFEEDFEFSTD